MESSYLKTSDYTSEDIHINDALDASLDFLRNENVELDSLYVFKAIRNGDSVSLTLLHEMLIKEIEKEGKNNWAVLPPKSALGNKLMSFTYLITIDSLVIK